jgi:hypothetical protein
MSENWLEGIIALYSNPEVKLIASPVMSSGSGVFFDDFQSADCSSIFLITHLFFSVKKPIMCSGANLSYLKECFLAVGGYEGNENILSGDYEFLLKKFFKHYGASGLKYLTQKQVVVRTPSHDEIGSLFSQRIRWASKWNQHKSISHAFSSFFPFLIQLYFISTLYLLGMGISGISVFLIIWVVKIFSERYFLNKVLDFFEINIPEIHWLLISLIHPWYVLIIGIGALRGKYSWKGRNQE